MRVHRTLGCLAVFAIALGPQLARADDPAVRTETKTTTTSSDDGQSVTVREERTEVRMGDSWSLRGGASLGSGAAFRAQVSANTGNNVNNGYLNVEAGMLFALGRHFDLGFNLRVPLFNLGVSPGLALRWQLIEDKQFHLALVGNVQVPMLFVPGFWLGLSVEPGLLFSYFVNERVELFGGFIVVVSPLFINPWVPGSGHVGVTGIFRAGLAYTLSTSNIGFFANLDIGAGYEPVRRFIVLGNTGTGIAFSAALTVGSQFKF